MYHFLLPQEFSNCAVLIDFRSAPECSRSSHTTAGLYLGTSEIVQRQAFSGKWSTAQSTVYEFTLPRNLGSIEHLGQSKQWQRENDYEISIILIVFIYLSVFAAQICGTPCFHLATVFTWHPGKTKVKSYLYSLIFHFLDS